MSAVIRTNEALWQQIKTRVHNGSKAGPSGTWNARKAQLAVKLYKDAGGDYVGPKQRKNSLARWSREKWGYIDGKKGNRYLPEKIRSSLTRREKAIENRRKRSATRDGLQRAKYSDSVLRRMQSR